MGLGRRIERTMITSVMFYFLGFLVKTQVFNILLKSLKKHLKLLKMILKTCRKGKIISSRNLLKLSKNSNYLCQLNHNPLPSPCFSVQHNRNSTLGSQEHRAPSCCSYVSRAIVSFQGGPNIHISHSTSQLFSGIAKFLVSAIKSLGAPFFCPAPTQGKRPYLCMHDTLRTLRSPVHTLV